MADDDEGAGRKPRLVNEYIGPIDPDASTLNQTLNSVGLGGHKSLRLRHVVHPARFAKRAITTIVGQAASWSSVGVSLYVAETGLGGKP